MCRVFKKKCFFKTSGGGEGSSSQGHETGPVTAATGHDPSPALYIHQQQSSFHHHLHPQATSLYKPELALHYSHQLPTNPYSQIQVQDLLPNPRQRTGYDFDGCEQIDQNVSDPGREVAGTTNDWAVLDSMNQMNQMSQQQPRGGEMDLWGYGK